MQGDDPFDKSGGETDEDRREVLSTGRRQYVWLALYGLLAVSLWAQWLGPGILAELRSEDGSDLALALQVVPLAAIAVGAGWRHPAGRLALVPASFLPGLALLPEAEWANLGSSTSLMLALATFALYLFVAAGRPTPMPQQAGPSRPVDEGGTDSRAGAFRRFVGIRFGIVAVLFGVVTYALFFEPDIQRAFATLEGETATRSQQVVTGVVTYFGWMIAVYIGAVLPSLNWEYHRRRSPVPDSHSKWLGNPERLGRRIAGWLGCLLVVTIVVIWWLL